MMHGVRAAIPRGKVTGELIQAPLVWDTPPRARCQREQRRWNRQHVGGNAPDAARRLRRDGAFHLLRRARRLFPFIEQTKRVSGRIFQGPQPRLKVRCGVQTRTTRYPFLKKLFADGGYQGPEFHTALTKLLPQLETEIIKRSDHAKGFVVLPRRWVVERTIAWLNRCRRLPKDWENLNRKALAFLRLTSIRLMLRKLCNPT